VTIFGGDPRLIAWALNVLPYAGIRESVLGL